MFIEIGEYENVIESQKFVDEIRTKKLNVLDYRKKSARVLDIQIENEVCGNQTAD